MIAASLACLLGCETARPDAGPAPPRLTLAFHTCAVTPVEGFKPAKDEANQDIYIAELPFLTEGDVQTASLVQSETRNLVQLEFAPPAADRIARLTTERRGVRLAIFVDDKLVMSPWIWQPITAGSVLLDGGFTRARAKEIVQRLNNQRVNWRPTIREDDVIEVRP
jgi:preprotein translocase subunit SecD